ncbi:NAD(P)H-dependent oxidoreductase [Paucibacter sp. R3-3]|uniref:NAD(P)H-dependent oxidoreductase n=1 Tax=Roseateles agri TaxID=3098619 RepID=A0ABU5DMZ3_9BURK|nr:NAD(P)H-dependent oxidoreductase [Paucibacter sp. R3-3]MDY0747682.1 NAD(P)H-dependent oxidoreductase [Paucibacter sp. R3-3]
MTRIVALSGSLSRPSRTRALVELIAGHAAAGLPAQVEVIDIAELAPALGNALVPGDLPPAVAAAQRTLAAADLIIIGSPVYKGSYSGLLKHFLDLVDPGLLSGKVAILAATGGSDRHALVLDHQWRPLASFFELVTAPSGLFVKDSDFVQYQLPSDHHEVLARVNLVVAQAHRLLRVTPTTRKVTATVALAA